MKNLVKSFFSWQPYWSQTNKQQNKTKQRNFTSDFKMKYNLDLVLKSVAHDTDMCENPSPVH